MTSFRVVTKFFNFPSKFEFEIHPHMRKHAIRSSKFSSWNSDEKESDKTKFLIKEFNNVEQKMTSFQDKFSVHV